MYQLKNFDLNFNSIKGLSEESINEHLGLYKGYLNNTNMILEFLSSEESKDANPYQLSEMRRRLSFEFNGMKNHEYYFEQLVGGPRQDPGCPLGKKITAQWGSTEAWMADITTLAKTRGVGWAITYYDPSADLLINSWVDEQHLGHLNSLPFIFGVDMWEHSFVTDYQPSGKGQYIEDYLHSVNFDIVCERYQKAAGINNTCE